MSYFTIAELNPRNFPVSAQQQANLEKLISCMNVVREAYGEAMVVTSGLRDPDDQKRIYAEKNAMRAKSGLPPITVPMGSKHLLGAAVDISDPGGKLWRWCQANEAVLVKAGLWLEKRQGNWQHFQCIPPSSGSRWFSP